MITTSYPAQHSLFVNEKAIIKCYRTWDTIKNFFTRACYAFPVMYTDGLLSHVVSDGEHRTPWGIAIGDYVIAINAPTEEMTLSEARKYNNSVNFAGYKGTNLSVDILRYIRSNTRTFNKLLERLGGVPFLNGFYATDETSGKDTIGISFARGLRALCYLDHEDRFFARPAIDIANLY